MPTISYFYGIYIKMFFNDHVPPHFHAVYGDVDAMIEIETLEVMKGELPNRALKLIREWGSQHQAELSRNWEYCQTDPSKVFKINPLD